MAQGCQSSPGPHSARLHAGEFVPDKNFRSCSLRALRSLLEDVSGRNAVYQLAALTVGARLAVADG
jgi:hypothetical protein